MGTGEKTDIWPNFFVVGAMKSATTSIVESLARHTEVFISPIKEPTYFATDVAQSDYAEWFRRSVFDPTERQSLEPPNGVHIAFVRNRNTYLRLFETSGNKPARGDASTYYLISHDAAANIAATCPDAKIIIVLREPIGRAYSHYVMNLANGDATGTFQQELDREAEIMARGDIPVGKCYVTGGCYYEQVKRYLDLFPREQVLILLYDEISADYSGALSQIMTHLGIDTDSTDPSVVWGNTAQRLPRHAKFNEFLFRSGLKILLVNRLPANLRKLASRLYYEPITDKNQAPDDSERAYLRKIFEPDIRALGALIARDLSHWLAC